MFGRYNVELKKKKSLFNLLFSEVINTDILLKVNYIQEFLISADSYL